MKRAALIAVLLSLAALPASSVPPTFIEFESGPVRPVALSPNGSRLFVTNIPDNRLEVFVVNPGGTLTHALSIPVGMEPVAVAARTDTEVWVVNHLSDSVSVVDLAAAPPRVVRTLLVGDEPRDIVFAGAGEPVLDDECPGGCAFISTAHRGQQRTDASISGVTGAGDPQLTTPEIGRADVWVFDLTDDLGPIVGGTLIRILTFFADTPRALATDGTNVYVAAFHSGNQTTSILEVCVRNGFAGAGSGMPQANCPIQATVPGGVPGPSTNCWQNPAEVPPDPACEQSAGAPETGIIVQRNATNTTWVDSLGRDWNAQVPFSLPDSDVFKFDADTFAVDTIFTGVGTILFNMAVKPNVDPANRRIYVTNTESPNLTMFEGPGIHGGSTVQGHLSEARVTVLNPTNGTVDPQHLNNHINYELRHTNPDPPLPEPPVDHGAINAQAAHSLATPLQPVVSSNGEKLYVAAFGSSKIGVFDTADIEAADIVRSESEAGTAGQGTSGTPAALSLANLPIVPRTVLIHDTAAHTGANFIVDDGAGRLMHPTNGKVGSINYRTGVGTVNGLSVAFDADATVGYESDVFDATLESPNYITTTGGGPAGLALDEVNNRLYVLTRFDNTVHVIDPTTKATLASHTLDDEEPPEVVAGRPFLYDAQQTSANGEASCASCHIFGDFDSLAWNLGNPDEGTSSNTQPSATPFLSPATTFHPMKGPMTTQTLRGMATHGGMHWRGDRVSGFFTPPDPGGSCTGSTFSNAPCDEDVSFRNFIVAFEGLVGKQGTITGTQMQQFSDFILQVFLPPNPVRPLTNALTGSALAGEAVYFSCGAGGTECSFPQPDPDATDTVEDCDGCHNLDPLSGFFGSGGEQSFEGEPQNAKVPHYRNLYAKIGMFSVGVPSGSPQVRGFGFLHDGAIDTLKTFHTAAVFSLSNQEELDLEQFGLQAPTDLAPIVGQQVTLTATNGGDADPRIALMIQRAAASFDSFMLGGTVTECDVVVKGSVGTTPRGWVREASGLFRDDTDALWNEADVHDLATRPLTYTCAPPGSGRRMGIDRDLDGNLDSLPEPGFALSLGSGVALIAALARRRDGRRQRTMMK